MKLLIRTNIETKLVIEGTPDNLIGELQAKIADEHHDLFPELGSVTCSRVAAYSTVSGSQVDDYALAQHFPLSDFVQEGGPLLRLNAVLAKVPTDLALDVTRWNRSELRPGGAKQKAVPWPHQLHSRKAKLDALLAMAFDFGADSAESPGAPGASVAAAQQAVGTVGQLAAAQHTTQLQPAPAHQAGVTTTQQLETRTADQPALGNVAQLQLPTTAAVELQNQEQRNANTASHIGQLAVMAGGASESPPAPQAALALLPAPGPQQNNAQLPNDSHPNDPSRPSHTELAAADAVASEHATHTDADASASRLVSKPDTMSEHVPATQAEAGPSAAQAEAGPSAAHAADTTVIVPVQRADLSFSKPADGRADALTHGQTVADSMVANTAADAAPGASTLPNEVGRKRKSSSANPGGDAGEEECKPKRKKKKRGKTTDQHKHKRDSHVEPLPEAATTAAAAAADAEVQTDQAVRQEAAALNEAERQATRQAVAAFAAAKQTAKETASVVAAAKQTDKETASAIAAAKQTVQEAASALAAAKETAQGDIEAAATVTEAEEQRQEEAADGGLDAANQVGSLISRAGKMPRKDRTSMNVLSGPHPATDALDGAAGEVMRKKKEHGKLQETVAAAPSPQPEALQGDPASVDGDAMLASTSHAAEQAATAPDAAEQAATAPDAAGALPLQGAAQFGGKKVKSLREAAAAWGGTLPPELARLEGGAQEGATTPAVVAPNAAEAAGPSSQAVSKKRKKERQSAQQEPAVDEHAVQPTPEQLQDQSAEDHPANEDAADAAAAAVDLPTKQKKKKMKKRKTQQEPAEEQAVEAAVAPTGKSAAEQKVIEDLRADEEQAAEAIRQTEAFSAIMAPRAARGEPKGQDTQQAPVHAEGMPNETAAEQAAAAALKGKSHGVPDGSVRVGADAQTSTPVDAAAATETEAATKAQSRRKRKRKPKVQEGPEVSGQGDEPAAEQAPVEAAAAAAATSHGATGAEADVLDAAQPAATAGTEVTEQPRLTRTNKKKTQKVLADKAQAGPSAAEQAGPPSQEELAAAPSAPPAAAPPSSETPPGGALGQHEQPQPAAWKKKTADRTIVGCTPQGAKAQQSLAPVDALALMPPIPAPPAAAETDLPQGGGQQGAQAEGPSTQMVDNKSAKQPKAAAAAEGKQAANKSKGRQAPVAKPQADPEAPTQAAEFSQDPAESFSTDSNAVSSVVSSDSDEEDLATRLVAPPPVPESSYSSSDVSSSDSDSSNEEEAQSQEAVAGKDEGDVLTEPDMPHDSQPDGQSAGCAAGRGEVQSDSKLESELASGAGAAKSKGKKAVVHDQQAESAKGGEKDGSGHQGGQDEEVGEEAGTDNEGALGGDEAVPNSPSPSRSKGSQVQRSPPAKTKEGLEVSDDELLSEIAYRPISDWGSTKSKVQSVVRRGIKIWQNRDRMQQGLPTKNGKTYINSLPPEWWPMPSWDSLQTEKKSDCIEIYTALQMHLRGAG